EVGSARHIGCSRCWQPLESNWHALSASLVGFLHLAGPYYEIQLRTEPSLTTLQYHFCFAHSFRKTLNQGGHTTHGRLTAGVRVGDGRLRSLSCLGAVLLDATHLANDFRDGRDQFDPRLAGARSSGELLGQGQRTLVAFRLSAEVGQQQF